MCLDVQIQMCTWMSGIEALRDQEASALLSKRLDEGYQALLKEHELNLGLSSQAEVIHMCWQEAAQVSNGSS